LKPRCALKVAVVGNRRFGGETDESPTEAAAAMKRQAARACTAVWQVIVESMPSALEMAVPVVAEHQRIDDRPLPDLRLKDFYSVEAPRLAVLSALAAGADQIGAGMALEVGRAAVGMEVELEAVLPLPERDYPGMPGRPRPEFRRDEAAALAKLAAQARQVVRLDGGYDNAGDRNRAYQQGRDVLLQHADVLMAIYDPAARGSPAGTLDTVDRALAGGLPVVALLVAAHESRIAIYTDPVDRPLTADGEWAGADPLDGDGWRSGLVEEVRYLLALPHQIPAPAETGHDRENRLKSLAEAVNRLRLIYGEAPPHRWCRGPVLERAFGWAWQAVLRVGSFFSRPLDPLERIPQADRARDEITLAPYAPYYDRASALADAYMRTYRGAFVLAFALAGVAVAAAVILMAVSMPDVAQSLRRLAGHRGGTLMAGDPPLLAILVLGGLKIGIIVFLIVLERVSYQARYQEHATDFRYLAEKIRPMQWLAPVGTVVPAVDLPAHLAPHDPRGGWMPWLVRAVARGTPPVSRRSSRDEQPSPREISLDVDAARVALERARSEWLQGQVLYHRDHARRMHGLDEGLERLAKILLWTVLALAVLAFVLKLLYLGGIVDAGQVPFLLGAGAAMLPAFIAALGGIMFQSEARRLQTRSEAMYHALRVRQRDLEHRIAALAGRPDRGVAWPAAQHLRALSAMMIEETGDWKVLYETHEIHAG
jgi:hypothetical protein